MVVGGDIYVYARPGAILTGYKLLYSFVYIREREDSFMLSSSITGYSYTYIPYRFYKMAEHNCGIKKLYTVIYQ